MKHKIRVGHKDYKFNITNLSGTLGITDHEKGYISISDSLDPSETVSTLLHELSHALAWVYGRHNEECVTEENWCDMTGNGFTMVFRDNKWLLDYIKEAL